MDTCQDDGFRGFSSPNFTPLPNEFFQLLPSLKPNEVTVFLVILNHTCRFHRTEADISYEALQQESGVSSATIASALKGLLARQLILKVPPSPSAQGRPTTRFAIHFNDILAQNSSQIFFNNQRETGEGFSLESKEKESNTFLQNLKKTYSLESKEKEASFIPDNSLSENILQNADNSPKESTTSTTKESTTCTLLPSGSSDTPQQQSTLFPDENESDFPKKIKKNHQRRSSPKSSPPLRDSNGHSLVHQAMVHFLQQYPEAMRKRYGDSAPMRYRPKSADGEQLKRLLSGVVVIDGESLTFDPPTIEDVLRLEEHFLFHYEDAYIIEHQAWTPAMFCASFNAVQVDFTEWQQNGGKHVTPAERKYQEQQQRKVQALLRAQEEDRLEGRTS